MTLVLPVAAQEKQTTLAMQKGDNLCVLVGRHYGAEIHPNGDTECQRAFIYCKLVSVYNRLPNHKNLQGREIAFPPLEEIFKSTGLAQKQLDNINKIIEAERLFYTVPVTAEAWRAPNRKETLAPHIEMIEKLLALLNEATHDLKTDSSPYPPPPKQVFTQMKGLMGYFGDGTYEALNRRDWKYQLAAEARIPRMMWSLLHWSIKHGKADRYKRYNLRDMVINFRCTPTMDREGNLLR